MVTLPNTVQEIALPRLTNAVIVGHCLFTQEQFDKRFTTEKPAPALLAEQLTSYKKAARVLDEAYAVTLRNVITDEISALDTEGDQLVLAVQDTFSGAKRMAFLPDRQKAGYTFWEHWKKYKIDTRENLFAEWSKVQQVVDESVHDYDFAAATTALGLTSAMARLGVIAAAIREKVTERAAELPELGAMKQAREAIYPEYRTLIELLNAFVLTDEEFAAESYDLVANMNNNINYTRLHAMAKGSDSEDDGGDNPDDKGDDTPDPAPTPDPEA